MQKWLIKARMAGTGFLSKSVPLMPRPRQCLGLGMPGQARTVAETSGQWELAVEGISERWMEWTRLAAVGLNASPGDQRNRS